jgi:hypothetical protein
MRQPIEALGLLDELLAIITRHCGGDSLELVPALHAKAEVLEELDKLDDAVAQLALARDIRAAAKGTVSTDFAFASLNLATLLARQVYARAVNAETADADNCTDSSCAEPSGGSSAAAFVALPVVTRIGALAAEATGITVGGEDADAATDMIVEVLDLLDRAEADGGQRRSGEEEAQVARVRGCFFELTGEVWVAEDPME